MLIQTKHFGEIEADESKIVTFEGGLPGFESFKQYTLYCDEAVQSPFRWLQSIDNPELAFAIIDPFFINKDYDIEISDETVTNLGIEKIGDVLVYAIVVVPEDVQKTSINLKAPVIINARNNKGAQIILDTARYSIRHYILDELRAQEELRQLEKPLETGGR